MDEAGGSDRQPSIWPQLSVRRGLAAVDFYKAAFGAVEGLPGGRHWEIGKPLGTWPPSGGSYADG